MSTVQGKRPGAGHAFASGGREVVRRIGGNVVAVFPPPTPAGAIGRWVEHVFGSPAQHRARLIAELELIG